MEIAFTAGIGQHVTDIPASEYAPLLKGFLASSIFWDASTTTTKFAILLTYLELIPLKTFRHTCYVVMVVTGVIAAASVLMQALSCIPLWSTYTLQAVATCPLVRPAIIFVICGSAVLDFVITLLPMVVLWKLQMPRKRKIGLMLAFSTLLMCVCELAVQFCFMTDQN